MANRFHVALSYPSEHHEFVLQVAEGLAAEISKDRVFYAPWYEDELIGVDGDLKLQSMYEQSDLVVPFFSRHYSKPWCSLEWETIRGILLQRRKDDSVIPVRLDDTEIKGWGVMNFPILAGNRTPQEIAGVILRVLSRREIRTMKGQMADQQSALESQKRILDRQQEIINKLVVYSMAFFYFDRLQGLHDALVHGTEYIFHKGDAKDLIHLRDGGYIQAQGIGEFREGEDISKRVKLTPIGEYYVALRREYERQGY